jgi:hypothetical protein
MSGCIDLDCERYEVKAGSISHGRDGYVFSCTICPVSEGVWSSLTAAARLGAAIRLVFPKQQLLLERVEIERTDGACIRIVGHVSHAETKKGLLP